MSPMFWVCAAALIGFAVWGALLFWRGRAEEAPARHETRRERRKLQHKIKSS